MTTPLDYEPPQPRPATSRLAVALAVCVLVQVPWLFVFDVVGMSGGLPSYGVMGRAEACAGFAVQFLPAVVGVIAGVAAMASPCRYDNPTRVFVVVGTGVCSLPFMLFAWATLRS